MNLTPSQLKRLAREARKLAMEIAGGAEPEMYAYSNEGWCACGVVSKRAGLGSESVSREIDREVLSYPGARRGLVSDALEVACYPSIDYPSAPRDYGPLVFPLLALGDALEERAAQISKEK